MRQRDGAVVRCDRIEIAVDDAYERGAIGPLIRGDDALGWWILREVFRIVKIGRRPSGLPRAAESRIVCASDVPLCLGELLPFDADTDGHYRGAASLFHSAVIRRLP